MKWIDTHCHVHFNAYKDDMDEVVERNLAEGVGMLTVGTQSTTSANGIKLAERYEGVWCSIGLHPNHVHAQQFHDVNELPNDQETAVHSNTSESKQSAKQEAIRTRSESFDATYYETLVNHPKVVAIGECGLDYYRIPEDADPVQVKKDQWDECKKQLEFATKHSKPVIIHCRDAHADQHALLTEVIENGGLAKRGVIHSFTGTKEEAQKYIELGFKLGINGILFFSKELQAVVADLPIESLVLETDAPYLTPPPNRGKRNEPYRVQEMAAKIAELQNLALEVVQETTRNTAITLFDLK